MKHIVALVILVLISCIGFEWLIIHTERKSLLAAEKKAKAAEAEAGNANVMAQQLSESNKVLRAGLLMLGNEILVASNDLKLAELQIEKYQAKEREIEELVALTLEQERQTKEGVKNSLKPTVVSSTNDYGRKIDKLVFEKLVGISGNQLATNVEFRGVYGRRLVFASNIRPIAFDVDEIHPWILDSLRVDAEEAKQAQQEIDHRKSSAIVIRQKYAEQAARLLEEQRRINEQFAVEMKRIQAESEREMRAEMLQARAVEAEELKARAAIMEAYKDPIQINNVQQNNQVVVPR